MLTSKKRFALLLGLALTVFSSAVFAKAPNFTVQVPYTGTGQPTTPQQDYYLYVNSHWQKDTKIAPDNPETTSFTIVQDKVDKQIADLTKKSAQRQAAGTATLDEKNIANLYACVRDQKGRDKAGLGKLAPILKRIEGIQNLQEYAETMADISARYSMSGAMLGSYGVVNDLKDNNNYAVVLVPPSTLSRELLENPNGAPVFSAYKNFIRDALHLYGRTPEAAATAANAIFDFEKDLGLHSYTAAENHDPAKVTNKMDLEGLKKLYSNVNVEAMLNAGNIGPQAGISSWYVIDPDLTSYFNQLYTPERLPVLKEYAIFNILQQYSKLLGHDWQKLNSSFTQQVLGLKKNASQEKQDIDLNQEILSSTYGRLYAATYFDEHRKQEIKSFIQLIMDEYRKRLQTLDWMTPATKAMALKKLDHMALNIGYPEAWPEYLDQIVVKSPQEGGCLLDNFMAIAEQDAQWEKNRIGKPVRKDLWMELEPQTINAGYNPLSNAINFPAGFLQEPFFDAKADRESNLGCIGTVIAHEITHCFDNSGAQFDEQGRQRNWWQPADFAEFKLRQDKIAEYYSRYRLANGTILDGRQTLIENIADLGSVNCITSIIGHNPEALRRAYTSYAKLWREKCSDNALQLMLTDIHSLSYVRTDAVLSTTDGFYEAYDIKPGDPMYVAPEDRVKLW